MPRPKTQTAPVNKLESFVHYALVHGLGALGLLITLCFFTATYDTAQVKLTLFHMGTTALLFLWAATKLALRQNPFPRARLPFLLPVFVYLGWNTLCFICAPYHMEAAEEFARLLLYGGITLLAATELTLPDIKQITRYILAAAWICFLYALVQVADGFFPGLDPMLWHGFFTKRVFSTQANPNFLGDFIIFASCLAGAVYVYSRRKIYLLLLAMGAVSLFFTESKGAWVAYACAGAAAAFIYTNALAGSLKKHLKKINLTALAFLLSAAVLAGYFTVRRAQSVSFRAHTWLGAFEMVKDAPVLGVGVGNFKVIYSAYRRPQIFYIEAAHNIETQHAENELLEQWAVSGTVGLAIFLWLVGFIAFLSFRRLQETGGLAPQREQNCYRLGYTAALAGMFVHSWVDISLHFVSSGFFFALFLGILLALNQPPGADKNSPVFPASSPRWLLHLLQGLVAAGWAVLAYLLVTQFYEVTAVLTLQKTGEILLVAAGWLVLLSCVGATAFVYLRAGWLMRRAGAVLVLCAALPLLYGAFCLFRANHYYSLAITFSNLSNHEAALAFFTKAVQLNPLQTEYRQFRASMLSSTLNMTQTFSPSRGDTRTPSNDFERAVRDFAQVAKRSPNHPLLHHNRGQLYYTVALRRSQEAQHAKSPAEYDWLKQDALAQMAQAKQAFERALAADPVNETTYAFLIQIALLENELDRAQYWLDRYTQGPAGVTEENFLRPLTRNPRMQAFQAQINARRAGR